MSAQLDPEDPTVRSAVFGRQVEQFLASDIGRYLIARADQQIKEGKAELVETDPENANAMRAAQFKVKVAQSIVDWLSDAIRNGEHATEILTEDFYA